MSKTLITAVAVFIPLSAAVGQTVQPQKPINRADYVKTVDARFKQMDSNHDGKVTKSELAAELQREIQAANARIAQQIQAKFRQLDTNHDGQLSLKEFMAIQPGIHSTQSPDQMIARLDSNHDGQITIDEFRAPELATFSRLDTNHDGVVTPAEIQAASGRR